MSVYKLHRSKNDNREVFPCTKPSVRACIHTPLWSINILIYCTHVTKIEGLLTHFSVLSDVCVRLSFER